MGTRDLKEKVGFHHIPLTNGSRRLGWLLLLSLAGAGFVYARGRHGTTSSSLTVSYGSNGLDRIEYNGTLFEDLQKFPADAFHIWHMKITDLSGKVLTQDGWGEANVGRNWDLTAHTWTYTFVWGSLALHYETVGDDLQLEITETNSAGSGVIVQGASFYPLALHFPSLPVGLAVSNYPQISNNVDAPGIVVAKFDSGVVATVVADPRYPLFSGFQPTELKDAYSVLVSSTTPDGTADFARRYDRPVMPGHSCGFKVTVHFADSHESSDVLAANAYANWRKVWPSTLNWPDRRIIGTAYLASSPISDTAVANGPQTNPRRYFIGSSGNGFDVRTSPGIATFQRLVLQQANAVVQNLRQLNAQGVITWDIEGEQYAQPTSYVGSPDQIGLLAPEMESVVVDASSPYKGHKLDDAYFAIIRSAGFRVGVCIRPQQFQRTSSGMARQTTLSSDDVLSALTRKVRFAHDRWGVTLFYLDSMVNAGGGTLDPKILSRLSQAFPDSLLIPEEYTEKDSAYSVPFKSFLFHGETGTDAVIRSLYPQAFSAVLINDVNPSALAAMQPALTQSVRAGDLLMVHSDYWQANNATVLQIYRDATIAER